MTPEPKLPTPKHEGRRIMKPHWWYRIITERDLHERILKIAERKARELDCFGGK